MRIRSHLRWRHCLLFAGAVGVALWFWSYSCCGDDKGDPYLVVVATTDLHGALNPADARESESERRGAPWLAGYIQAIRDRVGDEKVLLLDSGDFMQGTLLSNTTEGEVVVALFNKLRYQAVALGNHEFDYGPVGPDAVPTKPGDDPLGALKSRAAQARFPLLSANVFDKKTRQAFEFPGLRRTLLIEKGGKKIGIIGISSELTASVTHPLNVENLYFESIRDTLLREVPEMRRQGAELVIVLAHSGAIQKKNSKVEGEIVDAIRGLPRGYVDLVLAGHTHQRIAEVVNDIPLLEADAHGRYLGIAMFYEPSPLKKGNPKIATVSVTNREEKPPYPIPSVREVKADPSVTDLLAPFIEKVRPISDEIIGTTQGRIWRDRDGESPLGNLVADSMLEAIEGAEIAMTNSGGIRNDVQPGVITFGDLYEVLPFDNKLILLNMTGDQVRGALAYGTSGGHGHIQISGLRVYYVQDGRGKRIITVKKENGEVVKKNQLYKVVTSDFLYHGGDGYSEFKDAVLLQESSIPLRTALVEGVKRHSPVQVKPIGRFVNGGGRSKLGEGK
ncbi:MAG: bifunctional metallophosphatase/5'-nucleotidase [Deltaproteobacteria bacterium]|nr:bifunctional metallophosphatase/5'-nucleotidase [Deltaproteobacteria bacterium]